MIEKEFLKLSRKQLLELLLKQTQRADQLEQQLREAEQKLQDRILIETQAGSIAEASLKLNGVFEAAQSAAVQYLDNIQQMSQKQSERTQQIEREAMDKAEAMIAEAEKRCAMREAEAERKLQEISAKLRQLYRQEALIDHIMKEYAEEYDDRKS